MFCSPKYTFLSPVFYLSLLLLLNACSSTISPHSTRSFVSPAQVASIYVATAQRDASNDILALWADTGNVRWRRHIAVNTPALLATKTTVYVVGGLETLTGSRLYAFDAFNGILLWQVNLKSFGLLWMQSIQDLLFLAGPVDGNIYAIHTSDGTLVWQKTLTNTSSFVALALHDDLLYAPSFRDGTLYALRIRDGSLSWKYQSSLAVIFKPSFVGAYLYLLAQDENASQGALYALDSGKGTLLWQYRSQQSSLAGLAVAGAQLVVASTKGELSLLHVQNGMVLWRARLGTKADLSVPLITSQKIMVVNNAEHLLYALDQQTGEHLWQKKISCLVVRQIEQRKDNLYLLGLNDGSLCVVQNRGGSELWHVALASTQKAVFFPLVFVSDQLVSTVSPDTGFLYMLHQVDGTVSWHYSLGGFEASIPAPVAFAP